MTIRHVTAADAPAWERMREALWPSDPHAADIAAFFAGRASEPDAVFVAAPSPSDAPVAFVELSERRDVPGADGARTGYVEGLYVEPAHRVGGVTRGLLRIARHWAQERGCRFFASDRDDRVIFDRACRPPPRAA